MGYTVSVSVLWPEVVSAIAWVSDLAVTVTCATVGVVVVTEGCRSRAGLVCVVVGWWVGCEGSAVVAGALADGR